MENLFLGLDCSTQSLSCIVIDDEVKKIVYELSINFDQDLPHYETQNGCLKNADSLCKHSSPLMWAESLDILFKRMKADGVDLNKIRALSGSGQQHGSVYLNAQGVSCLSALDTSKSLTENLQGGFSRLSSPVWMDSSTIKECQEIQEGLGGPQALVELTGSEAFERFTAAQIRKFYKTEPENYHQTQKITLVSAFMASLLTGSIAPIDFCDGSGMNLMDIKQKIWDARALEVTAPHLKNKLVSLSAPWTVLGHVNSYFVQKYGMNKQALSVIWSGDNPCSLVGLGIVNENTAAISLGTSFTYFSLMNKYRVDKEGKGHVFATPTDDYMPLICFKNGSLAIEKIKNQFSVDWDGFNEFLRKSPPGNQGKILLPYFEPEIVPKIKEPGIFRCDLDTQDAAGNCRAVIEAQMMSMRLHSDWIQLKPKQIYVTGGASVNLQILQIMADVFQCPVRQISISKSAALGAALRAVHANRINSGIPTNWEEITSGYACIKNTINPQLINANIYDQLIQKYAETEKKFILSPRTIAHRHRRLFH